MIEQTNGKNLLAYLKRKGIKVGKRYISSKKEYQLNIRDLFDKHIYLLSQITGSEEFLDSYVFHENHLRLLFQKIPNLKDYKKLDLSFEKFLKDIQENNG